jgi:hypothetical protein
MDRLKNEKTAESREELSNLKAEIAFLVKGRKDLEEEMDELRKAMSSARYDFEQEITLLATKKADALTGIAKAFAEDVAAARSRALSMQEPPRPANTAPPREIPQPEDMADELHKMRLAGIAEVEEYLVAYKEKRLAAVEKEITKATKRKK